MTTSFFCWFKINLYFCTDKTPSTMEREYTLDKEESSRACEPPAQYGTVEGRKLRVVSDEELARCMTLEESERLITEKIYRFYHPDA